MQPNQLLQSQLTVRMPVCVVPDSCSRHCWHLRRAGHTHDIAFAEETRHDNQERIGLIVGTHWPGGPMSGGDVFDLAETFLDTEGINADDLLAFNRLPDAMSLLAVESYLVESTGAVVIGSTTKEFWDAWGLPKNNDFAKIYFP